MQQFRIARDALELASTGGPRDLPSFERYAADLKRIADDVASLDAEANRNPWTRIHVQLVRSGLWARLKPCSRSVYMVLCVLSDRRKRVTIAGVKRVARLAGLSVPRTLFAYRELRDHGLIWRRRVTANGYRPYMSGLTGPDQWQRHAAPATNA